ncbi:hypothetical protein F5141DRAFT_1218108 [Pisolithus sp. B1]|nr:hypothetical protein F5141DRAFT_1218108 [Pisolithus sp. B1]
MPRGKADDVPRFSGHPEDLLQYLEDVRNLCMQASCFDDHEWAQWSIFYLGIDKFEQWRSLLYAERDWADFVTDVSRLFLSFRCPAVRYLKHDLYNLIDKQKMVKIDSYEALLDYQLHFTKVAAHLRVKSQLSSIEKDDLFLKGFNREFQSSTVLKIQSLTHSLQDSSKLSKAPGESSRSQALKVDGIEVAMAELSSLPLVKGRCKSSFNHIEVTSYIAEEPLTVGLQGGCLQGKLEEQRKEKLLGAKASVELKATEASGDSPVPQSKYLHPSSSPHADILPQNPPIEPRDAQDELRTDERPIEAVVLTLKVPKPTPEPRDDLCEVPEQAGCTKVEEIKSEVEVERQSKVVAQRKPPEVKI